MPQRPKNQTKDSIIVHHARLCKKVVIVHGKAHMHKRKGDAQQQNDAKLAQEMVPASC